MNQITVKSFYSGSINGNTHTQVKQILFEAPKGSVAPSYFAPDAKSGVISAVFSEYAALLRPEDKKALEEVFAGIRKKFVLNYKNEEDKRGCAIFTKSGTGIRVLVSEGAYSATNTITALSIPEEDICFGTVASFYGEQGTKDIFTHELFSSFKEAERYVLESKEHPYLSGADAYRVEVFSKSHIIQTAWYKRSMEELGIDELELG